MLNSTKLLPHGGRAAEHAFARKAIWQKECFTELAVWNKAVTCSVPRAHVAMAHFTLQRMRTLLSLQAGVCILGVCILIVRKHGVGFLLQIRALRVHACSYARLDEIDGN